MNQAKLFIFFCLFVFNSNAESQENFRFQCDFSIKTKNFDSTLQLTVGSVYCNRQTNRTVFRIQFPSKETWLQTQTGFYDISENKNPEKLSMPEGFEQNIFLMILKNQLANFDLENKGYVLKNVRTEDSLTILEWYPPKKSITKNTKILISRKKNQLFGIVFFTENEEIPEKIFFNKYLNINGLAIPTEIFKIFTLNGKESYEKTTLENIKINNFENDNFYTVSVPDN